MWQLARDHACALVTIGSCDIGRHGVETEEFEDVCFSNALVLRAEAEGRNPVYHVLGETEAGRHLLCVVIAFPDGKGYPVTARQMTEREQRRDARWKKS